MVAHYTAGAEHARTAGLLYRVRHAGLLASLRLPHRLVDDFYHRPAVYAAIADRHRHYMQATTIECGSNRISHDCWSGHQQQLPALDCVCSTHRAPGRCQRITRAEHQLHKRRNHAGTFEFASGVLWPERKITISKANTHCSIAIGSVLS